MVKAVQPEETRQAAALVNSRIRDRRVLVNWWQMLVSLDAKWSFRKRERLVLYLGLKMLFMNGNSGVFQFVLSPI